MKVAALHNLQVYGGSAAVHLRSLQLKEDQLCAGMFLALSTAGRAMNRSR